MPTLESALAYPGTCLFEGTPLSVGTGHRARLPVGRRPVARRGGARRALNAYGIDGVRFEPATFTPDATAGDGKFSDVEVHGVFARRSRRPTTTPPGRRSPCWWRRDRASGEQWSWRERHIDRLAGHGRAPAAGRVRRRPSPRSPPWLERRRSRTSRRLARTLPPLRLIARFPALRLSRPRCASDDRSTPCAFRAYRAGGPAPLQPTAPLALLGVLGCGGARSVRPHYPGPDEPRRGNRGAARRPCACPGWTTAASTTSHVLARGRALPGRKRSRRGPSARARRVERSGT